MSFEWTYVTTDLQMQKIIHWTMTARFKPGSSIEFYVDKARSGGDWENVGGPIENDCSYIDPERWNWNKDMNTFYRIRYDETGDGDWVYSIPVRAIGAWTRKDYALVKTLTRKELLSYKKFGMPGVILKRKEWGEQCHCVDYDTLEPQDSQCPECFGTGISGGYYAPIPLKVNPLNRSHTMQRTDRALADDTKRLVRCVAYPTLIKENDLWLDSTNGTRWVVRGTKNAAEVKGVPVIYELTLHRIPMTDAIYKEPEGIDKSTEVPEVAPTGTEHGWVDALCDDEY